jgi:hypothetical protein
MYTCCAIEQANTSSRLTRKDLISLVGDIINIKRKADGLIEICDIAFFRRIEHSNSRKQTRREVDQQEARRVLWLKYQTQVQHYDAWEKFVVEHGFGRWSETDEEKQEGNIVFFDRSRIVQADEYCFTLNGADEVAGGRPSIPFSTDEVPEAGEPNHKSSHKCTVL